MMVRGLSLGCPRAMFISAAIPIRVITPTKDMTTMTRVDCILAVCLEVVMRYFEKV